MKETEIINIHGTEFDEAPEPEKVKIECICPKCGQKHVMIFNWIGRGTPRKFCPTCKTGS